MKLVAPLAAVAVGALALAGMKKKKKPSADLVVDEDADEDADEIDDADTAATGGGSYTGSRPPVPDFPEPPEAPWEDPDYSISGLPTDIDNKLNRLGYHRVADFQSDYNKWSKRHLTLSVDNTWGPKTEKGVDRALKAMDDAGLDSFLDLLMAPGGMKPGTPTSGGAVGSAAERKEMLRMLGYENTRVGVTEFQNDYNRWPLAKRRLVSDGAWGPRTSDAAEHAINVMSRTRAQTFERLVYEQALSENEE